jgi:hypothetical protein
LDFDSESSRARARPTTRSHKRADDSQSKSMTDHAFVFSGSVNPVLLQGL